MEYLSTPGQIKRTDSGGIPKSVYDIVFIYLVQDYGCSSQPAIYTLRTDYKVQRGEKYYVDYQPYIASVGAAATQTEQDKVKKTIDLPAIAGYDEPQDNFTIDYKTVKDAADGKGQTGDKTNGIRYQANEDFRYKAKSNQIKIKHVFQDLEDFTKYTNPDGSVGENGELVTTQSGNTGSTMEAIPLSEKHPNRQGFVPEAPYITMQVPENATNFILEYRYNRAHYDVVFDTAGGILLPARTLYFGQVMPKIADESIPTKVGGEFQGWKPSVDLKTKDGKIFKANEIIKDGNGNPIKNLAADLIMPASKVTFTAVWKDKEKADYAVQFWAEKADHADGASLADKYDYIGTRVYKDQDTGSRPDLDNVSVKDIVFTDLDQARLNKIWANAKFNRGKDFYLNKFYVYNQALTHEQNKDPANVNLVKSVDSTGKTVYNIYYDRQVYDLYFTKSNAQPDKNTFYPEIWGHDEATGEVVKKGGPGNPYHYKARFNQLMLGWPNDAMQTKGFSEGYQSFGWGPNYNTPNWPGYLDTPPYRLNADEFLDMPNYISWGGYTKKIDKGDGTSIKLNWDDYTTLSFGIDQAENSMPHHMDFWMDGFKPGETIIRYDLYRFKADTNSESYRPKYPKVQGFTGKRANEPAEFLDEGGVDDKNDERAEVTPFPTKKYTVLGDELPLGKMKFIKFFFSDIDEFGDPLTDDEGEPLVKPFEKNGYLKFEYKRNKYPLRFNYDPSVIKGDSEFGPTNQLQTFYEFPLKALSPDLEGNEEYKKENPANILDNPEKLKELKLTDLVFTDPKDGKLKVKRPDNLSDQMVFKGWALDPAGTKLIWENPGEIMPNHPVNLYAKWGEPDYKWKVTFDPNGGSLRNIKEENLTTSRKKIQEGDIGQEEVNTYAKKEANDGDKQVFTVIQRQKLVEPKKPTRKGYDFMGWEVIRYKKDAKTGDYTNEIDTSYRDTYKVPELYSFGNDVVSPVYLKAIWVPNNRVDIDVLHYFLDKDFKLDTKISPNPDPDKLEGKRANYLVATTGDRQDEKYILATHEELEAHKDTSDVYSIYKDYNDRVKGDNTFFQQFKVEPEKIDDGNGNLIPNPKVENNVFKFFYKPFRTREYKVNYIDERFKGNETAEGASIIDQELVANGNRHYDARNYRPIPGWVLADDQKPQQQLFFDVNEKTNEFLGINGTGKDEITFYYKDVRVIEVPGDQDPPEGYVRVTFKAEEGGTFTDKTGKSVKELHYDVIKGLKSDLLPVPQELKDGETKANDKYYVTPEPGKKFVKWDKKPLLNANTIIDAHYTFTAYFDWKEIKINPLVVTEAFIDPNGTWTNDFSPTVDQLKSQVKWYKNKVEENLPAGVEVIFGDEIATILADSFKELGKADKEELVREVKIPAKIKYADNSMQDIEIPVKVYKNVYEALTTGEKPLFLREAEQGELKEITGNYVKVTVNPTGQPGNKDSKIYYVNPKAWVNIPEIDISEDAQRLGFNNWSADQADQNEGQTKKGVFNFGNRHKFTADTVISPAFAKDVVEQTDPNNKPNVPDSYVKVIVDKTANAELGADEKQTQTFWVNPTKEVTIDMTNPTGKTVAADPTVGAVGYTMTFSKWKSNETTPRTWEDKILGQFTTETTILAKYSVTPEVIKPIVPTTDTVHTPQGKTPTADEIKDKITPPDGKTISKVTIVENPDVNNPGKSTAKVIVEYTDGSSAGTNDNPVVIPVEVHKNIIPAEPGGQRPKDALDNYVKVIFKAGTGGSVSGDLVYYVSPEVDVDMTDSAKAVTKTPGVGYTANGGTWSPEIKTEKITKEKTYEFNFVKSGDIVEKTGEDTKKPDGYVTVIFRAADNGKLEGNVKEKIYYVNPKADIKLVELTGDQTAGAKQLAVPKTIPDNNYGFKEWVESIDTTHSITGDREHVAHFTKGVVTLTYNAGGAEGTLPETVSAKQGATVQLANAAGLSKQNAIFAGWKLDGDDKLYQPGASITLDKNRVATAQWTTDKHVIPQEEGQDKPSNVPDNYVQVTFDPTEKGMLKGTRIFWVDPDAKVTISVNDPQGKEYFTFNGWKIDNEAYDPQTAKQFKETTTVKATYKEADNIIPYDPNEPITKPEGYVRVTFATDPGLKLTEQKAYYVKKNAGITLGNADLVKPAYKEETGYKFKEWDKADDTVINADILVTAKATELDNVVPEKDANGNNNKKPEGYKEVTFIVKAEDADKGSLEGVTKFYVNPKKYVTINPPTTKANAGYTFGAWSQNTTTPTNYAEDTTIEASFNPLDAVIPKTDGSEQPAGYVTVTFEIKGSGGTIKDGEIRAYYVDPTRAVSLSAPQTSAEVGYAFKGWTPNPSEKQTYKEDQTIIGSFKQLPNIVPGSEAQPTGYVKVTFVTGSKGTLSGETAYYVNPQAGLTLGDLDQPTIKAHSGYKADGWNLADKTRIDGDLIVVAEYDGVKETPKPGRHSGGSSGGSGGVLVPSTPKPTPEKPSEGDLNTADHYQYLIGYPDGSFAPNRGMTRAEVATMFTRLLKDRPVKWLHYSAGLSDIYAGDWYADTVGYAVQKGIVSGYPDGTFKPNQPITRAEFASIASRFAQLTDEQDISFIDLDASHWGYKAVRSAASHGWISGYPDGSFRPEQAISRAEVTSITNRMLNRYADLDWIDAHRAEVIRFSDVGRSDWFFEPVMEATMGHDFTRDADGKTEHWTGLNGKTFI